MNLRRSMLPLLAAEVGLAISALLALQSADLGVVWGQVLFATTSVAVLIHALSAGWQPRFYHLFVGAYGALFLAYPLTAPLLEVPITEGQAFNRYVAMTSGGVCLFSLSYEISHARVKGAPKLSDWRRGGLALAFWATAVVYVMGTTLVVLGVGPLEALYAATRVELMEGRGPTALAGIYLATVGGLSLALAPAYLRGRRYLMPVLLVVWCAMEVGLFLALRVRSFVLTHIGALVLGHVLVSPWFHPYATTRLRGSRRVRRVVAVSVTACLMIVLGSYLRVSRGLFETGGIGTVSKVGVREALRASVVNGDLGYAPTVLEVMRVVPAEHDFLLGQSYYRILFVVIPRRLWAGKPENTERIVGRWLTPGAKEQTTPPGIQGDLYINFGVAGVLGFVVFGGCIAMLDRRRSLHRDLALAASLGPMFHFVRGGVTNAVLLFGVVWFTALILEKTIRAPGSLAGGA